MERRKSVEYEEFSPKYLTLKRYSRRKNDRYELDTVVETEREKGNTYTLAYNISKSGMKIESRVPMEIGEILVLNFSLPNSENEIISVKGKVVNRYREEEDRRDILGVEFLEINDDYKFLDEFIEYNMIVEWLK